MLSSLNCEGNGKKGARIFAHTTRVTKLLNAFTIHARIFTHTMVYSFFLIKILDVWDKCHIYRESKTWKGWHVIKRLLACALIHSLYGYNVIYIPFLNIEKKKKKKTFLLSHFPVKKIRCSCFGFPKRSSANEKREREKWYIILFCFLAARVTLARRSRLLFTLFEENLYGFKFANHSFSLPLPPLYYLYISARRTWFKKLANTSKITKLNIEN